jgi:hypothetical protein
LAVGSDFASRDLADDLPHQRIVDSLITGRSIFSGHDNLLIVPHAFQFLWIFISAQGSGIVVSNERSFSAPIPGHLRLNCVTPIPNISERKHTVKIKLGASLCPQSIITIHHK